MFLQEELSPTSFESRHFASILLEPRSLVLVRDDMYTKYLHGIADREEDVIHEKVVNLASTSAKLGDTLKRTTRVSLTIRNVHKVLKTQIRLGRR